MKSKVKIGIILAALVYYALLLLWPFSMTLGGDISSAERGLVELEVTRSCLYYLLDNFLAAFAFVLILELALFIMFHGRARRLRRGLAVSSLFLLVLLSSSAMALPPEYQATTETPLARHVIVVTFDGTRSDVFWSSVRFINELKEQGVWAERMVTVYPTVTYPAHTSLFTGTWPQIHTVLENYYVDLEVEDLFEVAESHGYRTAMVTPVTTLANMLGTSKTVKITNVDYASEATDKAIEVLREHRPNLLWVHMIDPDEAGHEYTADSEQYAMAIRNCDYQVERLYNETLKLGWENSTVIIVTADHGMFFNKHHNVWPPLVIDVPLFMWGAPLKKNYAIAGARIVDLAPTIAFILGMPAPKNAVGKPLLDVFDENYVQSLRGYSWSLAERRLQDLKEAASAMYGEVVSLELPVGTLVFLDLVLLALLVLQYRAFKKAKMEAKKKVERS